MNAVIREPKMYERFDTREQASRAAAGILGQALDRHLAGGGEATLVLSGGSSPGLAMQALAQRQLPWERVHVTLSDERWVPPSDPDSNERMVREVFLSVGKAGDARFLPLYDGTDSMDRHCAALATVLRAAPFPFAATLLGMGADGHFASLFPDADNLAEGLDVDGDSLVIPVTTAASPHPRISLTLSALSRSDEIVLLVFGDRKLEVLNEAVASPGRYPVSRLLLQKRAPVHVLWAP